MSSVKAWSYSSLATFEKCPLLFKYKYIDKIKDTGDSEPMIRGTKVHKLAEQYVRGDIKTLPPVLRKFDDEFKTMRKEKEATVEQSWGFTKEWAETGWVMPDTWLRVKMDLHLPKENELHLVDYKTGRERVEEHKDQLMLYGVAGFAMFPHVEKVLADAWYIDSGKITSYIVDKKLAAKQQKLFTNRANIMLEAKVFNPRQSHACEWCQFSSRKNGPCKY